jgi:hypothetical protein
VENGCPALELGGRQRIGRGDVEGEEKGATVPVPADRADADGEVGEVRSWRQ